MRWMVLVGAVVLVVGCGSDEEEGPDPGCMEYCDTLEEAEARLSECDNRWPATECREHCREHEITACSLARYRCAVEAGPGAWSCISVDNTEAGGIVQYVMPPQYCDDVPECE